MKPPFHFLILTGVPFENSGGAQRAAQLARALLDNGHKVTFVYALDYREKDSHYVKVPGDNFRTEHVKNFNVYKFIGEIKKGYRLIILTEVPYYSFLPIIQILKMYSYRIIYELIDPWDTELGENWYKKSIEHRIINLSNILTATAMSLKKSLEEKSKREVYLIPNAYNSELFIKGNYERPYDLPEGPIIGYTGALWGSWFDIELVVKSAKRYSKYNFVLIGEYTKMFDKIAPNNVYFLKLKAQRDLPSYLSHFDLGLIPFKVNNLTDGINPLKVYEYLAMGLPVVSSYMPELEDIPNVFLSKNKEDFIKKIDIALNINPDLDEVENWLKYNTWQSRVLRLMELINNTK